MFDNLYKNIGEKIKGWAKWVFIVGAISSIIGAIGMLFSAEDGWMLIVGVLTLVVGPLVAWVSSWLLYAFGQITDDLHAMRAKDCPNNKATNNNKINTDEQPLECESTHIDPIYQHKIARITELRNKGLISEEMYQSAINNPSILDKF